MKKIIIMLLASTLLFSIFSCSNNNTNVTFNSDSDTKTVENENSTIHIGIVTGSVSQSEDDRKGAVDFQNKYGTDIVKLAIYPNNFTEEVETTIQTIVKLADDKDMKAII